MRATIALVVCGATSLGMGGCSDDASLGYSFEPTYDKTISYIAVPMWGNNTYSYGLEQQLTEALIAEVRGGTPWRVVDARAAQATLTGKIMRSQLQKVTTGRVSGLVEEEALTLTVDFEFRDNRTGKVIAARRSFSATDSFVPARGVGERIGTGEAGAVQAMARAVVNEIRSAW